MRNIIISVTICVTLLALSACVENAFRVGRLIKNIGKSENLKTMALQGDIEAQYKLGDLYCCGERPEFDNVEALRWWCKAAKGGQRDAMMEVGRLYEMSHRYEGSIIPRNNVMAYTYYTLAKRNGNEKVNHLLNNIKGKLSKDDIQNANYLLEQWPVIGCEISR